MDKEERKAYNKAYALENKEKIKARRRAYYQANKEKIKVKIKAYRQEHKEEIALRAKTYQQEHKEELKAYRQKNKEEIKAYNKAYSQGHREKIKARRAVYFQENKEKLKAYSKTYNQGNKDKIRITRNKYLKKRLKTDPGYKVATTLYTRMGTLVNKGKMKKFSPSMTKFLKEVIGLSQKDLIIYLEKKWHPHPITGKPMTWKNHSKKGWQIDHIKPIHKFDLTKLEEQKMCWHYTNLQPLWLVDHQEKTAKDIKK